MSIKLKDAKVLSLIPGMVYEGSLRHLFPKLGSGGGFRKKLCEDDEGRVIKGKWAYVALQATNAVAEWPDSYDEATRVYTYYGDQPDLSKDILKTQQGGNNLLEDVYKWLRTNQHSKIPPFFIFQKEGEGNRFLGLAIPGSPDIPENLALQRATDSSGHEVNNYVARFTILDTSKSPITYKWLQTRLTNREISNEYAPETWRVFSERGNYCLQPPEKTDAEFVEDLDSGVNKSGLDGETKKALVNIRVNQSIFRRRLLDRYHGCCLCGVVYNGLVRASHIKPWCISEPSEKLDVENGLLLCPNHDALFDQGLISFEDDGSILVSEELDTFNRELMNIKSGMKIAITEKNKKYLKYHRENIFKK